jgi:hypothetical protein
VCVWSRTSTHLFNQHGDEKVFGQIKDKSRKAYIKAWLEFRAFNPTKDFDVSHPGEEHCKDKIPYFRNKYSQKRNIGVSDPISTFMRL